MLQSAFAVKLAEDILHSINIFKVFLLLSAEVNSLFPAGVKNLPMSPEQINKPIQPFAYDELLFTENFCARSPCAYGPLCGQQKRDPHDPGEVQLDGHAWTAPRVTRYWLVRVAEL